MDHFVAVCPRCAICERSSLPCSPATCYGGHSVSICDQCRTSGQSCPVCTNSRRLQSVYGFADEPQTIQPPSFRSSLDAVTVGGLRTRCDVCSKLVPNVHSWSRSAGGRVPTATSGCSHVSCDSCRSLNDACPLCRRTTTLVGNGGGYVAKAGNGGGRAVSSRTADSIASGVTYNVTCWQCREPCPGAILRCDRCSAVTCCQRCCVAHIEYAHGPLDATRNAVTSNGGGGSQSSPPVDGGQQSSSASSSSSATSDRQRQQQQQQQVRLRGPGLTSSPAVGGLSTTAILSIVQGSMLDERPSSTIAVARGDVSGRYSVGSSGSDGSQPPADRHGSSSSFGDLSSTSGRSFDASTTQQIQSALLSTVASSVSADDLEQRLRNVTLQSDSNLSAGQLMCLPPSSSSVCDAAASGFPIDFGNLVVPPPKTVICQLSAEIGSQLTSRQSPTLWNITAAPGNAIYEPAVVDSITTSTDNSPLTTSTIGNSFPLFQAGSAPPPGGGGGLLNQVADGGSGSGSGAAASMVLHIDALRDRLNEMVNGFNLERRRASPMHSAYDVPGSDTSGSDQSATWIVRGYTTGIVIQLNNIYGTPVDDDADLDVVLIAGRGVLTRLTGTRRPEVGRRLFDFMPSSDGLHFVNATVRGRPIQRSPYRFLVVSTYPLSYSFQPPLALFADDRDPSAAVAGQSATDERMCRFHITWNLQETRRLSGGSMGLMKPWGVCVDPLGTQLLVADRDAHRIVVFDLATGSIVTTWGQHGPNPGQFHRPTHVAFDSAGRVVVTDKDNHRVQVFTDHVTWRLESVIGGSGHAVGLFRFPWEVAVNRRDDILVSDSKNFRVQLFARYRDTRGTGYRVVGVYAFDSQPTSGRGDECKDKDGPRGVAFDPFGFAVVADYDRHRVLVLSHDLRSLVHVIGHVGWSAVGQIDRPRGLTIEPGVGSIYLVVSRGNRRINHIVKMCPKTGRCLSYSMAADMCGICRLPGGRVAVVTLGTGNAAAASKNGVVVLQDTSLF
jgi:DNA-binding beta-propeller fold protein YncE